MQDGQSANADAVVAEIKAAGGEAIAHGANVANFEQVEDMVQQAMENWGRVDILINNAGILRDKTFSKMALDDFRLVIEVHLMGTANCTKAVWEIMREQNYGRIVFTSSSSGLYGNFGQANYGAAKMAMVGLMNTLHLEGAKYDIRVNCLAPTAGTAMTEGLFPTGSIQAYWHPRRSARPWSSSPGRMLQAARCLAPAAAALPFSRASRLKAPACCRTTCRRRASPRPGIPLTTSPV